MPRKFLSLFVIITVWFSSNFAALGENLALLIGNEGYPGAIGKLENPHNDVALVEGALRDGGFVITIKNEATRRDILREVRQFVTRLSKSPNAVGFFYYSGHGAARPDTNQNYIIPIGLASLATEDDWTDAVSLEEIVREFDRAPNAAKFIVLDACRSELKLPVKGSVAKAFVRQSVRPGMMIAYSTSPGQVAYDSGKNAGPYASALASQLRKPRQSHVELFQGVRDMVVQRTLEKQFPYDEGGVSPAVIFTSQTRAEPGKPPEVKEEKSCQAYSSTIEQTSEKHTGPTVTVNVVLLDAKPGCYITSVEHSVLKQYNYSDYKIAYENDRRLARVTFNLFDKPNPGYARIEFKVQQAELAKRPN